MLCACNTQSVKVQQTHQVHETASSSFESCFRSEIRHGYTMPCALACSLNDLPLSALFCPAVPYAAMPCPNLPCSVSPCSANSSITLPCASILVMVIHSSTYCHDSHLTCTCRGELLSTAKAESAVPDLPRLPAAQLQPVQAGSHLRDQGGHFRCHWQSRSLPVSTADIQLHVN